MDKNQSEIKFTVTLNENMIPTDIEWEANEGGGVKSNRCKSAFITIWDEKEENTLRIDLWTKDMLVDEMKLFCVQSLITMADTFERATNEKEAANDLREFGKNMAKKLNMLDEN